ncbi:MAG: ATP-binding protein [Desulfobacterales bacterium]|nr:ATP-binding protein [Desulfobacterales bacterium]
MVVNNLKQFYDDIVKMTVACVASLDNSGRIIEFHSYLDGIPPETGASFIGRPWSGIFVPEKNGYVTENGFESDNFLRDAPHPPLKILTSYQNQLFLEWNFIKIAASDTTSAAILAIGTDMTKHMELEQQLQHADRLATVGQLAAGIAHEINGPLNNILGYAQLSAKQQDLPEQVYQDLDNIIRMSLHAREVVKKVMLFSRQVPPKYDKVDLNEVIRESLYFTEPLCGKSNIRITCRLDENLPALEGDFAQLRQVVVNLMVNAVQAMPDGQGEIIITTGNDDNTGRLTMTVRDTGSGMSQETISRCFDPFYTTKDLEEGTGLGLSVVHGIIKAHGADIDVTSQSGEGTCFTVTFTAAPVKGATDVP